MIGKARATKGSKTRMLVNQLLLGLAAGGGSILALRPLKTSGAWDALGMSGKIALVAALVYVVLALQALVGMALPRFGAQMLNFEDEADLRDQRHMVVWSAASMLAMGALLAVLALAVPGGPVSARMALAMTGVAVVGLVWATARLLRDMDELMRAMTRETGEWAYYLVLAVCGGWAVLAHLGYAPGMGMLDFVTANYILLLVASFLASARRGMLKLR